MIFITGDTHGEIDINHISHARWPEGKILTKSDYLIIAGDFGVLWTNEPNNTERYWIKWLDNCPWTTLFIDGNHENFSRLKKLATNQMFGSNIGVVSNSIFHLLRGHIYTINDSTFFCFGGANSIDKNHRIEGISWWKEEEPTFLECSRALENLKNCGNKVDYIISHTAPISMIDKLNYGLTLRFLEKGGAHIAFNKDDITPRFLEEVIQTTKFKKLFCGHFHEEFSEDNFQCLYHDIVKIC